MGLKEKQMGQAFRDESLTVQLAEARGGGMCRRLFTSAVYTWANWPFPFPKGAIEGPNKIISLCSRWLPSLPPASFEPSSSLRSLHSSLSYTYYFLLPVLPLLSSPLFSYSTMSWFWRSKSNFIIYSRTTGWLTFFHLQLFSSLSLWLCSFSSSLHSSYSFSPSTQGYQNNYQNLEIIKWEV